MIDQDKNGSLSIQELKNVFELNGMKDKALWKSIMNEVDMNKDGKISFEEFTTVMTNVVDVKYSGLSKMMKAVGDKIKIKLGKLGLQQGFIFHSIKFKYIL